MKNELSKQEWIDAAMSSVDGIQRAEANPYLFTRIAQRLANRNSFQYKLSSAMARPATIIAVSAFFVLINLFAVSRANSSATQTDHAATEQMFAAEYSPADPLSTELNDKR